MVVIVTYDIKESRLRRELFLLLKAYGDRVQRSVFECPLEEKELETLKARIRRLRLGREDSVLFYPLCRRCTALRDETRTHYRPSQQRTIFV